MSNYHPVLEDLVTHICAKTNNPDRHYFRIQIAYFLAVVAAHMRISVSGWVGQTIPINIYAVNLAPSGAGKGHSTHILEEDVLGAFRDEFADNTFIHNSNINRNRLAAQRAVMNGTQPQDEQAALEKEFNLLGDFLFSFDSATPAAVKQYRQKLLMADAGALNLQIDEIGANLVGQDDPLKLFLELYDKGNIKEKLIKSTTENQRTKKINGHTPTNVLMFGEPLSLLDGGVVQKKFHDMLSMGYARRCLWGYTEKMEKDLSLTPEQYLQKLKQAENSTFIDSLSNHFASLANYTLLNGKITIGDAECLELAAYRLECEQVASTFAEHESVRKAELEHRYFKVLKLAGAYAYFDRSNSVTANHLKWAKQLVEDSGMAFQRLLNPEKPYVKFARYLATKDTEVTLAEMDDLPYFPKTKIGREDLIQLATAWGYRNNVVISRYEQDGVSFIQASSIQPTSLDSLIVSASEEITENYSNGIRSFEWFKTKLFTQPKVWHWLNHHLYAGEHGKGYRQEKSVLRGFNVLVLDVDEGCTIRAAQAVLKEYTHIIHTTKSHGKIKGEDRFRIILPINFTLKLDEKDYHQLMVNVAETVPTIRLDQSTHHRVKKWETCPNSQIFYNEGTLFDIVPFIPKTTKNEERQKAIVDLSNMDALERWFVMNTSSGQRNNLLYRYGSMLVDSGIEQFSVMEAIRKLNSKISDPLCDEELSKTVLRSISKRYS